MLILLILLLIVVHLISKNLQTFVAREKILDAIILCRLHYIDKSEKPMVSFDDMEPYSLTLLRFWDWGYERILPPEKYEIIKPFIHIGKGDNND